MNHTHVACAYIHLNNLLIFCLYKLRAQAKTHAPTAIAAHPLHRNRKLKQHKINQESWLPIYMAGWRCIQLPICGCIPLEIPRMACVNGPLTMSNRFWFFNSHRIKQRCIYILVINRGESRKWWTGGYRASQRDNIFVFFRIIWKSELLAYESS